MDDGSIRVLLIEDNAGDARLIEEILSEARDAPFELVHAGRLSTGMEHLSAGGIDIVLLDLSLPDSQGLDTFAEMHAQASEVPIILLTGVEDEALGIQAVREGAQDYLTKGQVDRPVLVRAIRYAIERKRVEEALRRAQDELEMRVAERTAELSKVNEELQIEITERGRAERELRRRTALDQVRVSVYEMREVRDMQGLLVSLYGALKDLGVEFGDCSVQIVDEGKEHFASYYLGPDRVRPVVETPLRGSSVYEGWRHARVIYRRDLDEEDRYDERRGIREDSSGPVRCVLDVPFSHGTIAINSLQPDAFSEADIETLRLFAGVVSEAYTRFEDIRRTEESEEKHRSIVEQSQDVIFQLDLAGNYLLLSPVIEELTGYSPEEFYADRTLGRRIVLPEDFGRSEEAFRRASSGEMSRDVEYRVRRKDGEIMWGSQTTFPVRDAGGRIIAIEGTIRDITEHREAEEKLRALNLQLQEAHGALGAAYAWMRDRKDRLSSLLYREEMAFLANRDGRILGVTERARENSGRSRISLLGSDILDLVHEDSRRELSVAMRQAWIGTSYWVSIQQRKGADTQALRAKLVRLDLEREKILLILVRESEGEESEGGGEAHSL